jgi:hypothetical protein
MWCGEPAFRHVPESSSLQYWLRQTWALILAQLPVVVNAKRFCWIVVTAWLPLYDLTRPVIDPNATVTAENRRRCRVP